MERQAMAKHHCSSLALKTLLSYCKPADVWGHFPCTFHRFYFSKSGLRTLKKLIWVRHQTQAIVTSEWQKLAIQHLGQLQGNTDVAPKKGQEFYKAIKSCYMPSNTPTSCWVLKESYRDRPLGTPSCAFMRRLKNVIAIEWTNVMHVLEADWIPGGATSRYLVQSQRRRGLLVRVFKCFYTVNPSTLLT